MLYKNAELVLKAINKMACKNNDVSIIDIEFYFHDEKLKKELPTILSYLEEEKYIKIKMPDDNIFENITLTTKGKNYENIMRQDRKNQFLRSFLLPVCVALATTIITLLINGLLAL